MKAPVSVALLTAILACGQAMASTAEEKALAQTLFEQGRALVKQGKPAEACAKFEESQRIDPAPGTLINLAACHEALGKTATAWIEFNESLSIARKPPLRPDREEIALAHLKDLGPRLSKLTIVVGDTAPKALVVTLDGIAIGRASFGTPFPVDPGGHTIEAAAPGKAGWKTTVTIAAEKDGQAIAIPELEDVPSTTTTKVNDAVGSDSSSSVGAHRTWGFVALGVGAVGLGFGTVFAIKAHSARLDGDAAADNSSAGPLYDDARRDLTLARIGLGIGAAGIITGVILVVTSSSSNSAPHSETAWRLAPTTGKGSMGLSVSATF